MAKALILNMPRTPSPENLTEFGRRLEMARIQSGYASQRAFAKELDITPQRYSAWLCGKGHPSTEMFARIRETTRVDLNWLVANIIPTADPVWQMPATPKRR